MGIDDMVDSPLISTAKLQANLENSNLRIFDVSVQLKPNPNGFGYITESGRDDWKHLHIPGSGFLDVVGELSDQSRLVGFMMPSAQVLADILGRRGIREDSTVVLYNRGIPMWSTRVWWMLKSIGLNHVFVLDGGWDKWCREARPTSVKTCEYEPNSLLPREVSDMWVGKKQMLDAVEKGTPLAINALSPAVYSGEKNQYGRAGHLPGSWNVYYADLIDTSTGEFRHTEHLKESFKRSGALDVERVITYCGGGQFYYRTVF